MILLFHSPEGLDCADERVVHLSIEKALHGDICFFVVVNSNHFFLFQIIHIVFFDTSDMALVLNVVRHRFRSCSYLDRPRELFGPEFRRQNHKQKFWNILGYAPVQVRFDNFAVGSFVKFSRLAFVFFSCPQYVLWKPLRLLPIRRSQ